MNKKQLCIIWLVLLLLTSMVWFPGRWFGYIVEGYPAIKSDSVEFLVRIFIPIVSFSLLIIYLLRDKKGAFKSGFSGEKVSTSGRTIFKSALVLAIGLLLGLLIGYFLLKSQFRPEYVLIKESKRFKLQNNEFKDFCKREGYREEVEALTNWLKEKQADEIAILYNVDDTYSSDLYRFFSQKLKDEKVKIVFSDIFKLGERSFYSRLKVIESLKPDAIIFLGNYKERIAFLEDVSQRSKLAFWKSRLDKIKWIE